MKARKIASAEIFSSWISKIFKFDSIALFNLTPNKSTRRFSTQTHLTLPRRTPDTTRSCKGGKKFDSERDLLSSTVGVVYWRDSPRVSKQKTNAEKNPTAESIIQLSNRACSFWPFCDVLLLRRLPDSSDKKRTACNFPLETRFNIFRHKKWNREREKKKLNYVLQYGLGK